MYLVSVYFDKTAEHILQRYINKIAEKTGNSFMVDNNVPPHMTISAIEARSENALLGAMDNLRNSLSNGTISIVSVGQLLLNGYLQDLSEKVFDEMKSIPESTVSRYYKPMSWLPHITLGKTLTREQMQMAFSVMQESFVPFEAAITEIGLARVNPHSDVDHTYRVAELCELIARDLKLDEYETDVAWLTGMLHDVGRFEQIKRYNTFNDVQSVDHANFGADLLFKEGLIDTYVDGFHDDKYGIIVENAIRNHSAFRIDERLDEYTVMFCNILRDADKVDIFRVNVDTPAEDIYNVTTEELKNSQVSPEVMAAFDERHAVLRSCKKTVVDHVAGHIALTFELVYPISLQIAKERGYLDKMMAFESDNEVTGKQFEEIRAKLNEYVESVKPL